MRVLQTIALFLFVTVFGFTVSAQAENGCIKGRVCLKIISQRWLTEAELARGSALSLQSIAVRLRLSNEGNDEIVYLTGLNSIEPFGYRLFRNIGGTEWEFSPKTKQRSESLFMQSGTGASNYLRLKPNSVLEFDLSDWSQRQDKPDEEHAFSIFIKMGGKNGSDLPVELISDTFRPLRE